jgi:hypothetical protein
MTRGQRLLAVLAAAGALALALAAPRREAPRAALAAVDARAFAALTGRSPDAAGALWDRLRAMGVSAALLREQTLADLAASGRMLFFSRAEVAKWRAAGLVAPGTPLRGGALWTKGAKDFSRAADALAARGVDFSTAPANGGRALVLPLGADLASVPAGFDPETVAALSSSGLLPVAAPSGPEAAVAGQTLRVRTLAVDAPRGEVLRAALGRPLRLIVFRPRADLDLERNLGFLRERLRVLRESGIPDTLPAPSAPPAPDRAQDLARLALVWLIGAAGPLLAARAALHASRVARGRVAAWAPLASPVPQVLAGLAAAWAVAALAGLAVAGAAPAGWRDGAARAWTLWTWCAPLAVGAAALYAPGTPSRRFWSMPLRRRDLAALLTLAVGAALLLAPRASLRASALWETFDRLSAAGSLWWWPWRWREALIGVPCLTVALALLEDRALAPSRADATAADPRGWLLLGLLAPAGLTAAVGGSGAPLAAALVHGAWALAFGAAAGAALAGLGVLIERWAEGPGPHRTIDLDSSN